MVEEGYQFRCLGIDESLQGKASEQFAILLEKLLQFSNYIRLLQASGTQAEFDRAFNFSKDVVLSEHGMENQEDESGESRFSSSKALLRDSRWANHLSESISSSGSTVVPVE